MKAEKKEEIRRMNFTIFPPKREKEMEAIQYFETLKER